MARRLKELDGLCDSVRVDALGNVIAYRKAAKVKKGQKPERVMISAHMDEIGFLVRHVDGKGFLRLHPVGGFDARNLVAQRVDVHTRDGERLHGLLMPQGKPIHLMRGEEPKAPKVDDLFVDLGLPAEEVTAKVEVGDMVTLSRSFARIGNHVESVAKRKECVGCRDGPREHGPGSGMTGGGLHHRASGRHCGRR